MIGGNPFIRFNFNYIKIHGRKFKSKVKKKLPRIIVSKNHGYNISQLKLHKTFLLKTLHFFDRKYQNFQINISEIIYCAQ